MCTVIKNHTHQGQLRKRQIGLAGRVSRSAGDGPVTGAIRHENMGGRRCMSRRHQGHPVPGRQSHRYTAHARAVLDWFVAHPRPELYLRQLDIPGVDTKFIESHRNLLGELLDIVLPDGAVDRSATGVKAFNRRYGLRAEAPLVRFRLLDRALCIQGCFSDLSLPPEEFAKLRLPAERVFITENRVNGLAFPDYPGSMVVFGLGYGLERLSEISWLRDLDVHYWGDIDTHGFGILNRLRGSLPNAQSFLMDRDTLDAHRELWVREPPGGRYTGDTSRLLDTEREFYEDLLSDRIGERVRLEQERISYGWLQRTLRSHLRRRATWTATPDKRRGG